jgi:hypothetical protein
MVKSIIKIPLGSGLKNGMLYYVLIGLCLSLAGVAGLQMLYLFYLDRMDKERKKRVVELERRCRELSSKLTAATLTIDQQQELIDNLEVFHPTNEEAWADVIEEN